MTSIHKIIYGSTSSHNKISSDMNATNIIIYLYKKSSVLFPCENQGVTKTWMLKKIFLNITRVPYQDFRDI
jgi:hypothetical protein